VFGKVTAEYVSGAWYVADIEQFWLGDIKDFVLDPDTKSLDYDATSHKEEIKGWTATAPTAPFVSTDEFPLRPTGRGAVIYRTVAALTTYLEGVWATIPAGWLSAIATWLQTAPYTHTHAQHSGFTDDSHDGLSSRTGYVRLDGDASRNKMSGVIADANGKDSIRPNTRVLMRADGTLAHDYEKSILEDDDGNSIAKHGATAGIFEIVETAVRLLISVVTDSDPTDLTKGALICKGGAAVTKQMVVGTHLTVKVGNVDVQTAANYFKHNGNAGKTNTDLTSGGIVYATLTRKRLEDVGPDEYVVVAS